MKKKDYELIAGVLKRNAPPEDDERASATWEYIVNDFSIELDGTSKTYSRNKFLQACGIETELQQIERKAKEKLNTDLQRQFG